MNQDLEHLRWLSIGFYVQAGIAALVSLFPVFHLVIGIAIVTESFEKSNNPPPAFAGWLFIGIALFVIIYFLAFAVCSLLAGKYLKSQTKYTFCLVMSIVSCLMFAPLGMILGIFAIIVLVRDSVKQLFNGFPTSQGFSSTGFNPPDWK